MLCQRCSVPSKVAIKTLRKYLLYPVDTLWNTGEGAQSTLGGRHLCPKICIKNKKNARILHDSCLNNNCQNSLIFMICPICPKNYQHSRNVHDFCQKNARILHNNYPKKFLSNFRGGRAPCLPRFLRLGLCVTMFMSPSVRHEHRTIS